MRQYKPTLRQQIGPEQKSAVRAESIRDLFVEHGLRVVIETKRRGRESIRLILVEAVHEDEFSLAKRLYRCWLYERKLKDVDQKLRGCCS